MICIDNNKNFPYIQRVPTLLINELEKPIVGINAFNWINSKSQFNNNTNNINLNPNKILNAKLNPLVFDKNDKLKGSNKTIDHYSFIKEDTTDTKDKLHSFYHTESNKIYTLPEGERINQNIQKKKLNKLLNLRSHQDTILFNDEIDMSMSSHNNLINEQKNISNTSKNSDINARMNNVNFSVPLTNSIKPTSNIDFFGKETARTVINKNNINNKVI